MREPQLCIRVYSFLKSEETYVFVVAVLLGYSVNDAYFMVIS